MLSRRIPVALTTVALLVAALVAPAGVGSQARAATTIDPDGPGGLDLTRAFTLTQGAPSSVIGYVEGGINWHTSSSARLADKVAINWREVPEPCAAASAARRSAGSSRASSCPART